MKFFALAAACLSAASLSSIGSVQAADASCTCNLQGQTAAGEVTAVAGSVSLVRRGGSPKVQVGTRVPVGSRVVVGAQSEATVAFSRECVVTLPANSDLIVSNGAGGLCVASRAGMVGGLPGAGGAAGGAGGAAGGAGGAAGAAGGAAGFAGALAGIGGPGLLAAGAVGVGAIGAAVAIGNAAGSSDPASR